MAATMLGYQGQTREHATHVCHPPDHSFRPY
jgi:hypothetical protein